MKRITINRWAYIVVVVLVTIGVGVAQETGFTLTQLGLALALPALTYPMGVLGSLCALPLIYTGIATVGEAHLIASPIYAIAGWLQWYVVYPKLFGKRINSTFDSDATRRSI